jgi:deazaflavin-dependent oxidoreductase (nitroreductase family)
MPSAYDEPTMEMMQKWVSDHLSGYLESGGARGHVMDMSFLGGHRYEPMLLLRYKGRKSGKTMITGLGYIQFGGEIVIVASLGGADFHPQWYLNLEAGSPIAFQVATQAFNATWRLPADDAEKEQVWDWVIKANPLFGNYRKISKRDIPLIMMKPLDEIPVFRPEDIG